ncbi:MULTISPECIES: FAD-dependent oxidoreductase [Methylosinus]|uniref:Pyridine nucleotide-disulfide oxidoreductase n=1 Tax=Methylosinus trichosporium (strain ATCC 35070 / NCIMB 11131 / UNIQEM 75 / OB3b) TaxID=595536 RepID=A0A2D2D2D3_METT3|nr:MULTISPECIES: FAD-dependent oxidoreductase [Methylosinus]ATQ69009.1 pyridine nucleotide-disulfide oxidoreductase [Methylosinus trichosporium OB3b]OBS51284.1 pyridine nucleotide-disulfide oxidoreductase [Methylosinus sp. 3S-1]
MSEDPQSPIGPDFSQGVALADLAAAGKISGRVGEEEVLVVVCDEKIFAVGAHCTHYHAPLIDGLAEDGVLRCPWHHALFDLATGEALHAPAFAPLACWEIEREGDKVFVRKRLKSSARAPKVEPFETSLENIVIIGAGAAAFAAAEQLRRKGYGGKIVMVSDDADPPVDRPNLSKDYLAGNAPEEWLPLGTDEFDLEREVDLHLGARATQLDPDKRTVTLADGTTLAYDRLLLATGAEPIRLSIPGADLPHVRTLRSLMDCRAIIERLPTASRAVVLGASFIGLEVAASLRARGLDVHVVAPEKRPMERVLGPQIGDFVRSLHERHGVVFHLDDVATGVTERQVALRSGSVLDADLVVCGVGVRPRLTLAEAAGLVLDRGVVVDAFLETSAPGVFAAGDIARWPDPHSGKNIRVEHWNVAERQGQIAALNMLGARRVFTAVPFFWSQHYDVVINYVGHAEAWDEIEVDGDIASRDCLLTYKENGRVMAVASIFRDIDSLRAEIAMERMPA